MRKEITFEQCSQNDCIVNIRNIFGLTINYVEDKIKNHHGQWDPKIKKFEMPLGKVPELAKDLQNIDRSIYIEQVPNIVSEMLSKYSLNGTKVKKQILLDPSSVNRYQYAVNNILRSIMSNSKGVMGSKNFHKVLIVCPNSKILSWTQTLQEFKTKKVMFEQKEIEECSRENFIWICPYESLWGKVELIGKYCFQTVILDEAEIFGKKISTEQDPAIYFRKFLQTRHFVFPIISKMHITKLEMLIPLFTIILPQTNFTWFSRRYKKENFSELLFIIKSCSLIRDICTSNKSSEEPDKQIHFWNKIILPVSEQAIERARALSKKNSQLECTKLLENPTTSKTKNEKLYLESMLDIFRSEKMQQIFSFISYLCYEINYKLVIVLETISMYRSIEKFLCENQFTYCHYEHHHEVIDFNKNGNKMIILIKSEYLRSVNFREPISMPDGNINEKLEKYECEQYLCLSGTANIIFPDIEWCHEIKSKEESLKELFRHSRQDIVRHYFILKGTYEEKWMKVLEESATKFQINLKFKEDMITDENEETGNQEDQLIIIKNEVNLAKVEEEYSHCEVIKGVTDIDEDFDVLEFEALQQRLKKEAKRETKKQKMMEKAMGKEKEVYEEKKKSNLSIDNESNKDKASETANSEECEIFLLDLAEKPSKKKSKLIAKFDGKKVESNKTEDIYESESEKEEKEVKKPVHQNKFAISS